MTSRFYLFVFESETNAITFVQRLAFALRQLAIMRNGCAVHVIDGSDYGQREEILRLARTSGAIRSALG